MDRSRPALARAHITGRALARPVVALLLSVPLLFLLVFFFYPLGSLLQLSLWQEGRLNLSGFYEIATSRYFLQTLWFTVWQAALSTLLTVSLALGSAFVFVRYRFWGKGLLLALSSLPFVLPTVVVAAALTALLGRDGLLNSALMAWLSLERPPIRLERTLTLILIAHVFYNYAVALRMIAGYWGTLSPRIEEAARALGAHGWRLWWEIYLPMVRPALTAAALLVYIFTFTSFGVVLILGGLQFATLEVEIYRQATAFFDLPLAASLSLVQIVSMIALMLVYTRLQRRNAAAGLQSAESVAQVPRGWRQWAVVILNLLVMLVLVFSPLIALVVRSLWVNDGFSVQHYTLLTTLSRQSVLSVAPWVAVGNSVQVALLSTGLALVLGVLAAYLLAVPPSWVRGLLDPLFMLPLATSAVTLGFGFIIALDEPPLNLRSSRWLVPIAHTLVALPFVVRSVLPSLRAIPPNVREAAQTLGADGWRVWRFIDLPLVSRAMTVGATFAFTVSMGEFGATAFVARPESATMPLVIFRLLGRPGAVNYGQALAMSVILLAVCAVAFVLIERLRSAGVGEF